MKLIKGRTLVEGQKVFVYFNLHKKCYSVKDVETGLVVAHAEELSLKDVTFKVSIAGRNRVVLEQKKNVHAGVVGLYQPLEKFDLEAQTERVTYNPYYRAEFYNPVSLQAVKEASQVIFKPSGRVYYNQ